MEYLFRLGHEWIWSKIYYDSKNNEFICERFHEEYLDTGTICDGLAPISDVDLWKEIVNEVNEDGMKKFLEKRDSIPEIQHKNGLTLEEFCNRLHELKYEEPYFEYSVSNIDNVTVIYNESKTILGELSQLYNFWVYRDHKKHGFCSQGEALEFALNEIKKYHECRIRNAERKLKAEETENIKNKRTGFLQKILGNNIMRI